MSESPISRFWLGLTSSFLLSGCMALPFLIPPLVEFGANLLTTAVNNYGDIHEKNMENLLVALQQPNNPIMPQGIIASPYGQTGEYQPTGYPDQNYQNAQGNAPSQGYPSYQDYPQQAYDPYQNQQSQYGGNSPYPNTQYPNPGQQGNPYSLNPVYPDQSASLPGYPTYPQNQYSQQNQQANAYPNKQKINPYHNPYPNQAPNPHQTPHPSLGQPYPGSSHPMDQQGQSYPAPFGNAGMAFVPAYPTQPPVSPVYQPVQPEMAQPTAAPISLDVLLVKKHIVNGMQSYLPIRDGDILLDGRGNSQRGDKFRVMFRPNINCYVYVIAVDGTAWAQGIFPTASNPFANPVRVGQQYVLPEGTNWFSLDQYQGIETIFFVASQDRRTDIEQILSTITGRERNPSEKPQAVSEPAIIPNGYSGARQGSSSFVFPTSSSTEQELLPTTYFVKTAGEDLRITRWFRHQ